MKSAMTVTEFETALTAEDFQTFATVEKPPGFDMADHSHPFEACALVTQGSITLVVDNISTTYAAGEIFRLSAGTPHLESAGAQGVAYRVGRKPVANLMQTAAS